MIRHLTGLDFQSIDPASFPTPSSIEKDARMRIFAFALVALLAALPASAQKPTGNGSQSGGHYNLNLIGHDECLGGDFTGSNRHVIAVLLRFSDAPVANGTLLATIDRKNKIFLSPGDDFQVTDGSGCDGAAFTLPDDVSSTYTVWARALGSPKDNPTGTITTCGIDDAGTPNVPGDDVVYCSTADNVLSLNRTKSGAPKFVDATDELLYVCADLDLSGTCSGSEKVPLFSDPYEGFYWDYDNNGLRLVQLRFYPVVN